MAEEHIGALVLIDCGPTLGTYQGRIGTVDPIGQTVTLVQPLRNGIPFQVAKVTLKAEDISNLRILRLAQQLDQTVNSTMISSRTGLGSSEIQTGPAVQDGGASSDQNFGNGGHSPKPKDEQYKAGGKPKVAAKLQQRVSPSDLFRGNTGDGGGDRKQKSSKSPYLQRPRSRPTEDSHFDQQYQGFHEGNGRRQHTTFDEQQQQERKHRPVSDLCAPLDHALMSTDFDFESNLKMFEKLPMAPQEAKAALSSTKKQAAMIDRLFNTLDAETQGKSYAGAAAAAKNIRHDEYVVQDPSRVYVNAKRSWRYMTESNVEVQALTAVQKRELFTKALNGVISENGFAYSIADGAVQLCGQLLKERNTPMESLSIYMIFSNADSVQCRVAKYLSRYFINRGHFVSWISSDLANIQDTESGVEIINGSYALSNTRSSLRSFVFVIGRQGMLSGDVSKWLLNQSFIGLMFVESDWRDLESNRPNEIVLSKLGVHLFWQLPCEDADSELKTPVYLCDLNLPSAFLESILPKITMKSKQYKFPFGQSSKLVRLRKL